MTIDQTKITVRRITEIDIPVMVNHRIAYLTEMQGERETDFIDKLRIELSGYFQCHVAVGSFIAMVAESEGQILSYGAMVIRNIPGDFNKTSYLEGDILNMYTIPAARRQGISTLVLTGLIDEAKSMGISKLALHTTPDGKKLYRKFGFRKPKFPYLELVI